MQAGHRRATKGFPQVRPDIGAPENGPRTAGGFQRPAVDPIPTESVNVYPIHDGGGYSPVAYNQTRTDPIQHRADGSDTVQSLAERYAVSPEAIRAANPQLGAGDRLARGETVEIPPPPQSVTGEVDPGSPNHSTTDVKVTLKGDDGSITWQPDSLSVKLTEKQELELGNSRPEGAAKSSNGVSISISGESSVQFTESQSGTHTSFTVGAQTQVSVSGEARVGGPRGLDVNGSVASGFESTYKVTLPGEATVEQAASVNPFDPTTIPVGGSVTVNGSDYVNTSFEASFRYIGVQTKVNDAEGVSYSIERVDEDTVRVTAGPTETINAFNGVGLDLGKVSAYVGRQDQLHGAQLQTAEFDISTAQGQAAFEHFNATGQIAHETPGVANVATISRIDYSSQTQLRTELGPLNVDLGGQANLGSSVQITYPDGSYSLTTDLSYGSNVPLTIEQRFDADGNELPGERSYQFEITTDRPSYNWFQRNILGQNEASEEQFLADQLNWALSGNFGGSGPVEPGDTVTLAFSQQQMQALMDQAQATVDGNNIAGANNDLATMLGGYDGSFEPTTTDFAISLARGFGNESGSVIDTLYRISSGADGDNANGQMEAIDVDVRSS